MNRQKTHLKSQNPDQFLIDIVKTLRLQASEMKLPEEETIATQNQRDQQSEGELQPRTDFEFVDVFWNSFASAISTRAPVHKRINPIRCGHRFLTA